MSTMRASPSSFGKSNANPLSNSAFLSEPAIENSILAVSNNLLFLEDYDKFTCSSIVRCKTLDSYRLSIISTPPSQEVHSIGRHGAYTLLIPFDHVLNFFFAKVLKT